MKKTITIVGGHILGGLSGGPTTHISELSELLKIKYCVNVISPNNYYETKLLSNDDLNIYLESKGPLMPLRILYRFLILVNNSDIIHFHSPKTALFGLLTRKKPIVLTLHGYYSKESKKYNFIPLNYAYCTILKIIEYISIKRADFIIVVGKGIGKYVIEQFNVNPKKIRYVPNGVDIEKINLLCNNYLETKKMLKSELGLNNKKIILFIKSFDKINGIFELVNSMPIVLRSHPDAHLIAIGGGPDKDEIANLCKKLKLDSNVTLIDQIPHDFVPMYLNIANIFVVPFIPPYLFGDQISGVGDTLGIVHLEAMAAKLPVIGTAVGNISELEKEMGNGIKYVPPSDSISLAKMISHLLSNPEICNDLGNLGCIFVTQNYDMYKIVNKVTMIYETLIFN